jgi:hypothetical protein
MKAFHRRDFLKFGSIAILGVAAGTLLERKAFADSAPRPLRLSVGCAGIDEVDRARIHPLDIVLAPAASLTSSDGTFLRRGARVKIAGISCGNGIRRVTEVRPHYLSEGTNDVPVIAWGTGGGRVAFTMPVEVEQRLRFSFVPAVPPPTLSRRRLVGGAAPADVSPEIVLSLMNEPDAVKLTRAYYVIVPQVDDAPEPKWGSYTLLRSHGHMLMHEWRDGFMQPVDCEHFVLRADYAIPGF